MTRSTAAMLGGVGIIAAIGFLAVSSGSSASTADAAAGIPVMFAERRDLELLAEAPGIVEPIRTVEVKSRASGEVLRVHAEIGDRVEQGQLLVEIDARDVQNALDQAIADLESAEVQASTTEANRHRMERLRSSGVVTQQEYESVQQAAAAAHAAAVRARTNLQLAGERRNDVIIRAPIAGTIISGKVEPGQIIASATGNVSGGTVIFMMADLSDMQVRTLVNESDIGQIQPSQGARISVEAYPERTFHGEVVRIDPLAVVEQNVTTFPVLVRLPNADGLLKPGMNAEVAIEVATREDVVVIPNAAVASPHEVMAISAAMGIEFGRSEPDAAARSGATEPSTSREPPSPEPASAAHVQLRPAVVFVKDAQGIAPRPVVLGVSDWEFSEIIRGLEAGDSVVEVSAVRLGQSQGEVGRRRSGNPLGDNRVVGGGG